MISKKKPKKCIVMNCSNHASEGKFIDNLCSPCHRFITTGEGSYSQMYRNSLSIVLREVGKRCLDELVTRLDPTHSVQLTVKEIL